MPVDRPPPEAVLQFAQEVRDRLFARCSRSVVPVYQGAGGYPTAVGTGTLFAVANERFLVTAAHVAQEHARGTAELLTSDPEAGERLSSLRGDAVLMSGELDVAIFRLGPDAVDVLRRLTFLRLEDVVMEPEHRGLYVLYGFPSNWWRPDGASRTVGVRPLSLIGSDYDGPTDAWRFDPALHVAVALADDADQPPAARQDMPGSLKGISGCSVWWLGEGALRHPAAFRAEDARVVAVQTGTQSRDSVAVATRWAAAFVLMKRRWPDLEPALRLYSTPEPALVRPLRG